MKCKNNFSYWSYGSKQAHHFSWGGLTLLTHKRNGIQIKKKSLFVGWELFNTLLYVYIMHVHIYTRKRDFVVWNQIYILLYQNINKYVYIFINVETVEKTKSNFVLNKMDRIQRFEKLWFIENRISTKLLKKKITIWNFYFSFLFFLFFFFFAFYFYFISKYFFLFWRWYKLQLIYYF